MAQTKMREYEAQQEPNFASSMKVSNPKASNAMLFEDFKVKAMPAINIYEAT